MHGKADPAPLEETEAFISNHHFIRIAYNYVAKLQTTQKRKLPSWFSKYHTATDDSLPVKISAPDELYNYASTVLNDDGLFMLLLQDVIPEGDGNAVLENDAVVFQRTRSYKLCFRGIPSTYND